MKNSISLVFILLATVTISVQASVFCIFEDDPNLLLKYKQGGADFAGRLILDANDAYTGRVSAAITPNQLLSSGFVIPVRENPAQGQYRYLTMAWKKQGGKHLIIQFHGEFAGAKKIQVYHAGVPVWTPTRSLAAVPPTSWTAYEGSEAIDLYRDLGDCNITAIAMSPLDGNCAKFDHLYLTSSISESKALIDPRAFVERKIAAVHEQLAGIDKQLAPITTHTGLWKKLSKRSSRLSENAKELQTMIAKKDYKLSADGLDSFNSQVSRFSDEIEKELAPGVQRAALAGHMEQQYGIKDADFALAVTTTMQKFFNDQPYTGPLDRPAAISLAGNEYEALQLLVMPIDSGLKNVTVSVSDLASADGKAHINKDNIEISLVGYVETQKPIYPIRPDRVGSWPDPLLANKSFDCNCQVQPVWITVYAPPQTPAGQYKGFVTVSAKHAGTVKLPLTVTVFAFSLPKEPYLKTAFSMAEWCAEHWYQAPMTDEVRRKWYTFMFRHRLNPMTLYPVNEALYSLHTFGWPITVTPFGDVVIPRMQDMDWAVDNGLNLFNVSVGFVELDRQEKRGEYNDRLEKHLKDYSEYLAKKGWADKGILYVFDEIFTRNDEDLRMATETLSRLKRLAPNLKTAATLNLAGKDKIVDKFAGLLDIWIPLTPQYTDNPQLVEKIKASGADVWWYVCNVPNDPWPTFSAIESPMIDSRIVFWMNQKYGVKGFLYYAVNNWVKNIRTSSPNARWPKTPWITQEVPGFNGDGILVYPGATIDAPLSSIRFENVRDGIEDYDYFCILKERIGALKAKGGYADVVKSFESLLVVDDTIAAKPTEHTSDPDVLLSRRAAIAKAIERIDQCLK